MNIKKLSLVLVIIFLVFSLMMMGCSSDNNENEQQEPIVETPSGPKMGGVLRVAVPSDFPTFDTHITTSNLVQMAGFHLYEGLFTLDEEYKVIPMLATGYEYDEENLTYVIKLREGVKFHNGKILTADDVVASLNRWLQVASAGNIFLTAVVEITKVDEHTIEIVLNQPNTAIPMALSYPRYQSAIYPAEVAEAAGTDPIREYIGTGPYKFVEHKTEQYAKMARFEDYVALDEPTNGWGGKKIAYVDEILFIPTPEASTRLQGLEAGEFHYAQNLSNDMYELMLNYSNTQPVIIKPDMWPSAVFNKAKGPFADKRMRQAFLAGLDMTPIMKTAFVLDDFYRLDHSLFYQEQTQWYSEAGKDMYNQNNVEKAKRLMEEAGYNGEKIRWLASRQYEFMYQVAMLSAEQLNQIGFNIEVEPVEWATMVERRSNPDQFEIFTTGMWITLDPGIIPEFNKSWPGTWDDAYKDELVSKINEEVDPVKRLELWNEFQTYFWDEVPMVKFGDYFMLTAKHNSVHGLNAVPFMYFYNVWLEE